jgi:hypothetical protein
VRKNLIIALAVGATLTASPASAKKPPELTPMELQALQSREYQTTKDQVFPSVVSVFQDLGYQISAADVTTGFISAGSANKNKTSFLEAIAGMRSSGGSRVTAFIETMPSGLTRVRLNFMNTKNSSSAYGSSSSKDTPVLDQKTYQIAFEHVEEALFERGALTKTPVAKPIQAAAPAVVPPQQASTAPSGVTAAPMATPAATSTPPASASATVPAATPTPAATTPPK